MYINKKTFREWWDVFHGDNPLTEIRLLGKGKPSSAYFMNCEDAIRAIEEWPVETGVYSPINQIRQSCYGKVQKDHFETGVSSTSKDDIEGRRWLFIDFDPKRASDSNSTDEEKEKARDMMRSVGVFLRDQGFHSPVVADSCNGYHLYYRISIENSKETEALVTQFLGVLDMFFSNDYCDIDVKVSDANRIAKVIGTKTVKGADTPDRPRRESKFVQIPFIIESTDIDFIRKVASMMPQKETPCRFNGYNTSFDLESFISEHNIGVAKRQPFGNGEKIILDECPFNCNHKAPDAALFVARNGAIGFKCLHNSCASYTWREFRIHFDPDAYSQSDRDGYLHMRDYQSTRLRPAPVVLAEDDDRGRKWMSLQEVKWQDPRKLTYIPTGFRELDRQIGGLELGDVTIISGLAGAGKTSILNNILLSTIQHGYKAAIWSGELSPSRFKSWINQAAAGRNFVQQAKNGEQTYYYCPESVAQKIDEWTNGKLYLYNNNYGNKSSQILQDVLDCIKEHGTQLLVFDNKMAMALDSFQGEKNDKEAGLINQLKDYAIQYQVHIILVCHPRKEQMNSLLRMESIAGNSDLYNCAANVILCHRVGRDFERRATEFFGKDRVSELVLANYGEVIEIAKNRSHGKIDVVFGLYWEDETRRFLNDRSEYVIYGWQDPADIPVTPPSVEWTREAYDQAMREAENDEDIPDEIWEQ